MIWGAGGRGLGALVMPWCLGLVLHLCLFPSSEWFRRQAEWACSVWWLLFHSRTPGLTLPKHSTNKPGSTLPPSNSRHPWLGAWAFLKSLWHQDQDVTAPSVSFLFFFSASSQDSSITHPLPNHYFPVLVRKEEGFMGKLEQRWLEAH